MSKAGPQKAAPHDMARSNGTPIFPTQGDKTGTLSELNQGNSTLQPVPEGIGGVDGSLMRAH
jgi:hypothetical protein